MGAINNESEKNEKVVNKMYMEFLSLPENVSLARVAVASFVAQRDLTISELEEIKVAVSESVSNAIIHGYKQQKDRIVRITATMFEKELEIVVEDEGDGIENVERAMQPAFSTDPERMGLGFVFIKSFMSDVKVHTSPGKGTSVIMRRSFEKQPFALTQEN